MNNELIREVAEYVIKEHTIQETANEFQKSTSSIKKYLAKVRDESWEGYDPILAERLKLAQAKITLQGQKQGATIGKRGKSYEEFTARMYADAYLSGVTIEVLSELSQIPHSTLFDMIRGIEDEELQKRIDDYVKWKKTDTIDRINKEQWRR